MTDAAPLLHILRAQSNAAIAARDADRVVAFMTDDVAVHVAGGPVLRGLAANRRAWEEQMRAAGYGGYVRTPDQITVADGGTSATELGQWEGRWTVNGRLHTQSGRYSATWQLDAMGWRIASETFSP
jgi:ketosteroid isomerase-like protein